jgi:hypothetical protein
VLNTLEPDHPQALDRRLLAAGTINSSAGSASSTVMSLAMISGVKVDHLWYSAIDRHPLCPTAASVGAALDGLAERLAKAGTQVQRPALALGQRGVGGVRSGASPLKIAHDNGVIFGSICSMREIAASCLNTGLLRAGTPEERRKGIILRCGAPRTRCLRFRTEEDHPIQQTKYESRHVCRCGLCDATSIATARAELLRRTISRADTVRSVTTSCGTPCVWLLRLRRVNGVNLYEERAAELQATGYAVVRRLLDAGDVLLVTRLDRLARSTRDLLNMLAAIAERKAGFRSLGDAWADTTTAHGR